MKTFTIFTGFIFFRLGLLFYLKGDRIQEVVTENSFITDVRSATIVEFVYAFILFYLKAVSVVPISTTWVFIGLLAGLELTMSLTDRDGHGKQLKRHLNLSEKMLPMRELAWRYR